MKIVRDFFFWLAGASVIATLVGLVLSTLMFRSWLDGPEQVPARTFLVAAYPWLVLVVGGGFIAASSFAIGLYSWLLDATGPSEPPPDPPLRIG